MQSFTAADINNVGIGWRNCDRADRCRWLVIKNRLPRPAVINRFKNAAVHRRHVENVRLRRHSADGACPPAAIRSNIPPTQNGIELSRARLANSPNGNEPDCDCVSNPLHKPAFSLAMKIPATNSHCCLNPDGSGAASNRKGNRMDSMSAFRASWKLRLVAFGIGILVAAAAFGIALAVSDDLRLLYVSGALLLAVAAFFLNAKAREDLIVAVLLAFAST